MIEWQGVRVEEVLSVDWGKKSIAVLATACSAACPAGAPTVILAQRHGFDSGAELLHLLQGHGCLSASAVRAKLLAANDIYHQYVWTRGSDGAAAEEGEEMLCKMTVIHPATAAHIAKHRRQQRSLVHESPALYAAVTEAYIAELPAVDWIENLLRAHEAPAREGGVSVEEKEALLHWQETAAGAFALFKDSKWDGASMSALYLLAVCADRTVRSIRDLRAAHLPLLRGMRETVRRIVPRLYPCVRAEQLRCYFHYQPTYYHLHLHVVHVDLETLGCAVGAAHLLDDVIDNLAHVRGDYYQMRTLTYVLGSEHELYRRLMAHGAAGLAP